MYFYINNVLSAWLHCSVITCSNLLLPADIPTKELILTEIFSLALNADFSGIFSLLHHKKSDQLWQICHCPLCVTTKWITMPCSWEVNTKGRVFRVCMGTSADQISCSRTWQTTDSRDLRCALTDKISHTFITCVSLSTVNHTFGVNPAPSSCQS